MSDLLEPKPEQSESTDSKKTSNTKNKQTILAVAIAILVLGAGGYWFMNSSQEEPVVVEQQPAPVQATEITEPAPTSEPTPTMPDNTAPVVEEKVLVEESILSEPIAEDVSLQQEEIDKLKEIEKQLIEQKVNLEAQSQDVDELIRLKEEQIRLFEAELAKKQ
ncbi:hypothetical protein [Moraxella sp. ZY210820]|uniref:hypothetical protein n=1 Tax=unclassified Moraxella TaxID=2685852 RepID=UPI0027314D1A|nr:hypothetical protein [Moraxella sp. ZY210820]WLF84065.1 hypothetical protein LU301_00700 [Moraxella sp. ZY210820]